MGNGLTPAEASSAFDYERRFVRAPGVLWRQVTDVVLVRTVSDPNIIELSGAAVLLWAALAEPTMADELTAELAAVVDAPLEVVKRDVRAALADLVYRGLATLDQIP